MCDQKWPEHKDLRDATIEISEFGNSQTKSVLEFDQWLREWNDIGVKLSEHEYKIPIQFWRLREYDQFYLDDTHSRV